MRLEKEQEICKKGRGGGMKLNPDFSADPLHVNLQWPSEVSKTKENAQAARFQRWEPACIPAQDGPGAPACSLQALPGRRSGRARGSSSSTASLS